MRHNLAVGERKALTAGASGKVLLAFASPALVAKAMLQAGRQSDGRGLTRSELQAQLAEVRRRGFAASSGERVSDAAAIAAPVFDATGLIIAALGISGAITRFTPAFNRTALPLVIGRAEELSRELGWRHTAGGAASHVATRILRNESKEQA
jgi:DNA-binding IclR family transcriptional regulator